MSATEVDPAKLEAFIGQVVTDMGAAISAPLFVIGDRLGLQAGGFGQVRRATETAFNLIVEARP
jgi:hypothetical protein